MSTVVARGPGQRQPTTAEAAAILTLMGREVGKQDDGRRRR